MTPAEIYLVDGCPGGGLGKTRYLSEQCERAVDVHGPSGVAITSLTRTAAAEIAGRVDLPDTAVGTLHAHAFRGLDRPELAETPEGIGSWNGAHPSLALTGGRGAQLEDAPIDSDDSGRSHADQLHAQVMNHRARLTPRAEWTPEQQDYAALWDDWKRETRRLDFTDLIEQAIEDLPEHPANPRVLLLDEAQDFSALELRLALRWAQGTDTTVIVGDLAQAIYGFRGADPEAFANLPLTGRRTLEQSYRVPRRVANLAHAWLTEHAPRGLTDWQSTSDDGVARAMPTALRNPGALIDAVREDLDNGLSVMVLAACGYMLGPLVRELRDHGLPFHNPYRTTAGHWNPMRGAARLAAFLRWDDRVWGDQARIWTWDDLRVWTEPLRAKDTLARGAKALIERKCMRDEFGRTAADTEVPPEMLCELLGVADTKHHPAFKGDVDWWSSNLRASQAKTATFPVEVYKRQGPAALRDDPRLVVGTVHSVKGGEADSVYLAPDLSKQGMWHGWHAGGQGQAQIARMIYVGLTRARRQVTVLQPSDVEHVPLDLLAPGDDAQAPATERWQELEQRLAAGAGR